MGIELLESPAMARDKTPEEMKQLNVLIPLRLMKELREYANSSLYQPSLGKIVAQAISEHLAAQRQIAASKAADAKRKK